MALALNIAKGTAQKGVKKYLFKDGENTIRLVGGILPRYVYWVKASNGKDIPLECLSFNRETERFDNKEVDIVPQHYPDKKCQWCYSMVCIDKADGEIKVIHLKKKLLQEIIDAQADLGPVTDDNLGWTVVFKKTKTGPLPINVSYNLQVLRCKVSPLTEEEKQKVAEFGDIDSHYPRPTVEEIKALIIRLQSGAPAEEEGVIDTSSQEAINELG